MEPFAPRSLGAQSGVSLTGKLIPWDLQTDQPVWMRMPMSTALYLPCFSDADALRAMMTRLEISGYKIKHIDDGPEFLSSIPGHLGGELLHIMLDPYFTPEGTVRFKQVLSSS